MKTMLSSVGGSSAPLILSIRNAAPDKIIFFVSAGSRELVSKDILPALPSIPDHDFIQTPDEQDVGECVRTLLSEVPLSMAKFGISSPWPDIVDYTGGTKTMSASVVWASAKHPCKLSYVGAISKEARDKGGLGVVVDGKERLLISENPWDKIAHFEVESAMSLFNSAQFANAAAILDSAKTKLSDERTLRLVSSLSDISKAFLAWDSFDHRAAKLQLERVASKFQDIADASPMHLVSRLKPFAQSILSSLDALKEIKLGEPSRDLIWDLLANASRRAFLEHKFEDATARCYSAIEKSAQVELKLRCAIDSSDCRNPELLHESLRSEFIRKYTCSKTLKNGSVVQYLQFGLYAKFQLLKAFDNPLGLRFFERELIVSHLEERNRSILAHGISPMDETKFKALFEDALFLLDITESQIPSFPKFP